MTRATVAALALGLLLSRPTAAYSYPIQPIEHVVVVILENTAYDSALRQPFLKQLASEGAVLTNYHALGHPSQPNYIGLVSGALHGVNNDAPVTLAVPHLGDLFDARGLTWKTYAESYPGNCDTRAQIGWPLRGRYVRRHVPFIEFANVQKDRARCNSRIVNSSEFDSDVAAGTLPSFALYIPNNNNNAHDTTIRVADRWMQRRFGPLLRDPRFSRGTLLVITFDEDDERTKENRVATILWGAGVRPGATSDRKYSHYSLLRTIEEIFQLGSLHQNDETARAIDDVLTLPPAQALPPAVR